MSNKGITIPRPEQRQGEHRNPGHKNGCVESRRRAGSRTGLKTIEPVKISDKFRSFEYGRHYGQNDNVDNE